MIEKVDNRSTNAEVYTQLEGVSIAFRNADFTMHPILENTFNKLRSRLTDYNQSINIMRGNKFTALLSESDSKFDNSFMGLRNSVESYSKFDNAEISEKADKLMSVLNSGGVGIHRGSYQVQYARMKPLVELLSKPEYSDIIDDLNLRLLTNDFIHKFTEFSTLYESSRKEQAVVDSYISATEQRKELITLYNRDIVSYLRIFITDDSFANEIKQANVYILETLENIKARLARKEH
jgi:hypothetical protein